MSLIRPWTLKYCSVAIGVAAEDGTVSLHKVIPQAIRFTVAANETGQWFLEATDLGTERPTSIPMTAIRSWEPADGG